MRASDGTTWLPIAEAAQRARVRVPTVKQWINRGKVRHWTLSNQLWVCSDDVADCELQWHKRRSPAAC